MIGLDEQILREERADDNEPLKKKPPMLQTVQHMVEIKIYPFFCPHCNQPIEPPDSKVHINTFPIGMTKKIMSGKRKKYAEEPKAKLQSAEEY